MNCITVEQYLNQWKVNYSHISVDEAELTEELKQNAQTTVDKANALLERFGQRRDITSGWRPTAVNKLVSGAAARSNHMRCCAVDLADPDGDLDEWCLAHPHILMEVGLWQEHPASTKGWCHVQIVPPKSGNRVFYP